MKKIITLLMALCILGAAAACSTGGGNDTGAEPDATQAPDTSTPEDATASEDTFCGATTYKVGVSIYDFNDCFMTMYRNELAAYFATLNTADVVYDVTILDAKRDMAEQVKHVDAFINMGIDVMIINLVTPASAGMVTEKVKAADIPVVYINREPPEDEMNAWDRLVYVGADPRHSGTAQGKIILDLPDRGDIDGDGVVRYVMIMGDPDCSDARYRTEYSIKALTDAGIRVETLFQQTGNWNTSEGQELAATAIAQFGAAIDVIFCNNDGMAIGAIEAIRAAGLQVGRDLYLVGVDAIPEAIDAIRAGDMTGTVLNDHIGQSHAAVDAAVRFLSGQSVERYYWVDYVKVTDDNINILFP